MKKIIILNILLFCFLFSKAQTDSTELPTGKGLPVTVKVGVSFIDVSNINENDGNFTATIDLRMRWEDLRLQFPKSETTTGYKDYKNSAAEKKMSEIWIPDFDFANLNGEPGDQRFGLRIYYDGKVEMLHRLTGTFDVVFDVTRFPFDKQHLAVELKAHKDIIEKLSFEFTQDELDFSQAPDKIEVIGWKPNLVNISREAIASWHGEKNSQITIALNVDREPGSAFGTIFLPLIASLLIPLFAIWLNKYNVEEGEFKVDAFELTSINIGGLFAVVALNFTVSSSYVTLAASDNCVMQLFTLNYLTLALSLAVSILFYRFKFIKQILGNYVQDEFFKYINWALPILIFVSGLVIVLFAIV